MAVVKRLGFDGGLRARPGTRPDKPGFRLPRVAGAAAFALATTATIPILSGCGSDSDNPGSPSRPPMTAGGQVEVGFTVNYGSFGTKANIDCAEGKFLNVGGSNNTLTVTGSCWGVNIGGADNRITFDKITHELSVVGLNNTVTYKAGDPQVNDLGSGNTVSKG